MGQVISKSSTFAMVSEGSPSTNFSSYTYAYLRTLAGGNQYIFLFFPRFAPLGATILSAKLRLKQIGSKTGATTLTLRPVLIKWSATGITYTNRPSGIAQVGNPLVSVTSAGTTPDGYIWEFDISTLMSAVSAGGVWWGFRVEQPSSTQIKIAGVKTSGDSYRPEMEVNWSDAPDIPDEMYPSGGRIVAGARPLLRGDFEDVSGSTVMQSLQVKTSYSNSVDGLGILNSGVTDSGEVFTDAPVYLLPFDVTPNVFLYWQIRVRDGAGLWSGWSRVESFKRIDQSPLTLTFPAVSPNNYVQDPTPIIAWSFAGTQRAFDVQIALASDPNTPIWSYGKHTSTDTSISIPPGVITQVGVNYVVSVFVWDTLLRETNGAEPAYVKVSRTFDYQLVGGVTAVTSLTRTTVQTQPGQVIGFDRATPPDSFTLLRDNIVVESDINPASVLVSGTTYAIVDRTATPRRSHTWKVVPVVNGVSPATNPTITGIYRTNPGWLQKIDGTSAIPLFNLVPDLVKAQTGAIKQVIGSDQNVIFSQTRGGYAGSVTARLSSFGGISADTFADRLEAIRNSADSRVYFTWSNLCILAVIDAISFLPKSKTEEVVYDVTFNLYERRSL